MAFTRDCCIKFTYKAADLQVSKLTQYCKKLPAGTGQAANVIPIHTKKTEEILGIADQKVCHPSLVKAVGAIKIKSLQAGINVVSWTRCCMASAKRNPASPTQLSHWCASVRTERGGTADTVQSNFEKDSG